MKKCSFSFIETLGIIEMSLTGIAEDFEGDSLEELIKTLRLAVLFEDVRSCRTDSIKRILQVKKTIIQIFKK